MKKLIYLLIFISNPAFCSYTLEYQQAPYQNEYMSICFIDKNNGWATALPSHVIHTTNGGLNWNEISNLDSLAVMFYNIQFVDLTHGWAPSSDGFPYYTTDGGYNWLMPELHDSAVSIHRVFFIDSLNGWGVGSGKYSYSGSFTGAISQTTDGGRHWYLQDSTDRELSGLFFIDSLNGWVVGLKGEILKTINGGGTWQKQDSITNCDLIKVFFADTSRGWAIGDSGTIIYTLNGGDYWQKLDSGAFSSQHFTDLVFLDSLNGWISGWNGLILKTSDGGMNWDSINSGVYFSLTSISFFKNTDLWICGLSDTILHFTGNLSSVNNRNERSSLLNIKCSPNPFSGRAIVNYYLPNSGIVRLSLSDGYGRELFVLADEFQFMGNQTKIIDAFELPSGVYLLKIISSGSITTEKVIIIN